MSEKEISELEISLSSLERRAKKASYKNKIPKLPKNINPSTMMGFHNRLTNWQRGLEYVEQSGATLRVQVDPQLLENYLNT